MNPQDVCLLGARRHDAGPASFNLWFRLALAFQTTTSAVIHKGNRVRLTTVDIVPKLLRRIHRDLGILAERLSDVTLGIRTFSPASAYFD